MEDLLGEAVINLGLLAGFLLILGIGGLIADYVFRISRSLRSIWTAFPSGKMRRKKNMIKGRPTAYMKPYYNGYFFLGRAVTWRATDDWGNHVASASTRKECEAECRRAGYTPIRDTD